MNTKQIIFALVVIAFYAMLTLGGPLGLAIQNALGGICFGWITACVARTVFKD